MLISNIKFFFFFTVALFLLSILGSVNGYCKNAPLKTKIVIPNDSSSIEVRKLNAEEQKRLLENKDYKYDRIGPAPKSLWDRFWEWFWRKVSDIFDSKGGSISFRIFEIVLIVGAIVLIVFLLLKNDVRSLFYGKSASVPIDFMEFEEDINKIKFDELIEDAIAKRDFRKAIRLHFLKLLKQLTDLNLIKWQIDKTNNDYSMELASSRYNSKFKELSLMYEYIWYGDFHLDETNFRNAISKFKEFQL